MIPAPPSACLGINNTQQSTYYIINAIRVPTFGLPLSEAPMTFIHVESSYTYKLFWLGGLIMC